MKTSGQAGSNVDVIDDSILPPSAPKGITGWVGITERGKVGEPQLVGSWLEYQTYFGGEIPESDFPFLARRCLDAGGKLKIVRVAHFTNIGDKTTIVGTKATLVKNQAVAVVAVASSGTVTVTGAGTAGETVAITITTPQGNTLIASAVVPVAPTTTTTAAAIKDAINAGTSVHGYSATNALGVVTISANANKGVTPNGYTIVFATSGTATGTVTAFAGGVTGLSINVFTGEAESVGAWANNKLWMTAVPAANGVANQYDLTVGIDGYDIEATAKNIPTTPSAGDITILNNKLRLAKFTTITTLKDFSKTFFTSGAENKTLITDIDHIGNAVSGLGINAFDKDKEITKIAAPAKAVPMIDNALVEYAKLRKDILALLRTPLGLDGKGIIDYREGTGNYAHQPIDAWQGLMYTGGLKVTHPDTGVEMEITELADVCAAYSKKASYVNEWFAVGGQKRGRISNALGVIYDLGNPARKVTADSVSIHGVNAVIDHETFGTVIWDNVTLQKADTLLKFANVAELVVYLIRGIKPKTELELFDPNDVETWKTVYRSVKYFMEPLKAQRAIWDYRYEGDQDIDDISQAVVNSTNVDAGGYQFNLFIQPKVGMKFVQINVVVKNSGSELTLVG